LIYFVSMFNGSLSSIADISTLLYSTSLFSAFDSTSRTLRNSQERLRLSSLAQGTVNRG
jgi:hypothetical protein